MNIAIYPRKSKKDDNSESMEQQIDDCKKYINKTYPNANIIVFIYQDKKILKLILCGNYLLIS